MNRRRFIQQSCGLLVPASFGIFVPKLIRAATILGGTPARAAISSSGGCGNAFFCANWNTATNPGDEFTSTTDGSSHLTASSAQAQEGAKSMRLTHTSTADAYVQKDLAADHATNWYRFYWYPSSLTVSSGNQTVEILRILDNSDNTCMVLLWETNSGALNWGHLYYRNDGGSLVDLGNWTTALNAAAWNEFIIQSVGGASGSITVWQNGTQVLTGSGLAYATYGNVHRKARVGFIGDGFTVTTTSFYWDTFEWRADNSW